MKAPVDISPGATPWVCRIRPSVCVGSCRTQQVALFPAREGGEQGGEQLPQFRGAGPRLYPSRRWRDERRDS